MGSALVVVVLSMAALNLRPDTDRAIASADHLRIYCAASVATPIEKVIESYNHEYGAKVEIVRTGGSGELAGQIKMEFETDMKHSADLYVSADDDLMDKAYDEGVITNRFPVALQRPVIAVQANSVFEISTLREMTSSNLKFGIASERAAVGKIVRVLADREGVLAELETQKATESENVMTLAQALSAGSLDAAVIWDTTIQLVNESSGKDVLKATSFADEQNAIQSRIEIGVLSKSPATNSAVRFSRYLSESDTSHKVLRQYGFTLDLDNR